MSRRRPKDDEGATLVIVLAFIALFGLLMSALLGQTETSLKRTLVTREFDEKVYAADAGIDAGIQALRNQDTLCGLEGSSGALGNLVINDKDVTVTCETIAGSSNGIGGYAVVTTDPSVDSLTTSNADIKRIGGSVFASGLNRAQPNKLDLIIQRGNLQENTATCTPGSSSAPASIKWEVSSPPPPGLPTNNPTPPWTYKCTTATWQDLDPNPALPVQPPPYHSRIPDITPPGSDCAIFRPGTYTDGIQLNQRNYFGSGVYYFPSGGLEVSGGKELVFGAPPAVEDPPYTSSVTACASDMALIPDEDDEDVAPIQGTGATIILGGDARIRVAASGGKIEVHARTGGDASEGGQGLSIRTVPAGTTVPAGAMAWAQSTRSLTDPTVSVASGTNTSLSAHGLVYTPGKFVDFFATNTSLAKLDGGVLTGRLNLQSSATGDGLLISIGGGQGVRRVQLTSTARKAGSRDVVSVAVLDVESFDLREAKLLSWRTQPN